MTDMNEVILKADRRGRLRYTLEQKQALIEAYQASGLSCPPFAGRIPILLTRKGPSVYNGLTVGRITGHSRHGPPRNPLQPRKRLMR